RPAPPPSALSPRSLHDALPIWQPYPRPLARTREYVAILRKAMAREKLEYDGEFFQLPHQGGTGLGKALRSTIHPLRTDIPILLRSEEHTSELQSRFDLVCRLLL